MANIIEINVLDILKKALIGTEISVFINKAQFFEMYGNFAAYNKEITPISVVVIDVAQDTNMHNGEEYFAIFTYENENYKVDISHYPEYIPKPPAHKTHYR